MKRIYNFSIIAAVASLMTVAGCTGNFEEYNKNPNFPYEEDISEFESTVSLFPAMVNTILHSQQNRSQHIEQMVGQYGGHIATSANWNANNFANFNPQRDWTPAPWEQGVSGFYVNYLRLRDLTKSEGYIFYLANIVRVASQHRITDIYGPIPYSQMGTSMTAEYDDVKDIYTNMINDLSESIEELTTIVEQAPATAVPIAPYDHVYKASTGAELAKWVKYANSLKLRLAMRIALRSETHDFAKNAMEEVMTHSIGPILNNADNALNSATPENDTPGYYAATGWGDVRINATLSTYMNAWNDPRTDKFMKKGTQSTPLDYTGNIGVRMGAVVGENNGFFDFDLNPDAPPATYTIMNVTNPEPVLLFCAAETYFLLAEAAVRNLYTGAQSAQELYETGIQKSMEQYGVPIGNYMSATMTHGTAGYSDPRDASTDFNIFDAFSDLNSSSVLAVAWDAQNTTEKKIEAIITQKWIAMYKLGIESWSEWRRTGYPRIFSGVNDKSGGNVNNPDSNIGINDVRMARRLPYPDTEVYSNPNYAAAVGMLGGADNMTTELWWAKGNQDVQ